MAQTINLNEDFTFKVILSPNPFDKGFTLQLESPLRDKVTVTIFDLLGKK